MCQLPSSPLKARVFLLIAAASKTKQTRNCNSLEGLISARVMLCSAKWINHWYSHTSISYRRKKIYRKSVKAWQTQLFTAAFHTGSAFHAMLLYRALAGMCQHMLCITGAALMGAGFWGSHGSGHPGVRVFLAHQAICWRKGHGGQCLRSLWNFGRRVGMPCEFLTQLWNKLNKRCLLWGYWEYYTSS